MPDAPEILIVADDLSGAADCAIACAEAGLASFVALDGTAAAMPGAQALAVDADSRRLPAAQAAEVTAEILRLHAGETTRLVYKKIDSTLRGNVAVEIAAGLTALRRKAEAPVCAIVAPAFPGAGRTTRNGHLLVRGVPVEETELWRNEGITGSGYLPDMLAAAGLRVAAIGLPAIRDPDSLAQALIAASRDHDALVCDAETDADLAAIAQAGASLGPATLWAGSAGIAAHLPKAVGLARPKVPASVSAPRDGPVICLVGSLSGVSRTQFENLPEDRLHSIVIPPDTLRAGPDAAAWIGQSKTIGEALAAAQDIAILIGAGDHPDPAEGLVLCRALARMIAPHMARAGGLVATGGETARAMLLALGATALRLVGQVESGVPRSEIAGGPHEGLPVITKAGGFGAPDTLAHCRAVLRADPATAPLPARI